MSAQNKHIGEVSAEPSFTVLGLPMYREVTPMNTIRFVSLCRRLSAYEVQGGGWSLWYDSETEHGRTSSSVYGNTLADAEARLYRNATELAAEMNTLKGLPSK